jgi:hypothetical protein
MADTLKREVPGIVKDRKNGKKKTWLIGQYPGKGKKDFL